MSQEVIEITEREIEVIEVIEKGLIGPTGPTGPQANINYTVVTTNQTLTNSQNIAADTSGGSFTLTLPASPNAGDSIDIFDYANTFDTNPLTIARNGQPIESLAENLTANVEGAYFTLIYTGATRGWQILPRYGVSGIEDVLSAEGDLLYRGASSETRLPIGTAGQVLKVNSGATAPEWGSISGSISVTGSDLTLSGTTGTAITNATLANSGVVAGTYTKVTVDAKGRATVGASATKSDVGLGNVDNTSDTNKPVSTATQTALNLKANLDSPALTGTPTAPTASAGTNTTQVATTAFTLANRGDRYLTTSTSSHSITTGSKTFTVQSGLSYTATQDVTIVYDGDPTNKHMHATVTSYSGTTLVVNVESVQGSGGPFTAWTINVGGLLTAQGALLEANNLSDVANPTTALANIGGVPTSRTISAGTGLTGGGDLTANRTLAVSYGTTSGTACEGNDARLSDARTPLSHVHAASDVTSGVFDNARINFAAPNSIGSTTRNSGAFTTLTANNGIITASAPVLDLSQTWNASGTTFTGLRFNVTNTASATTSLLADFQVGGTSAFNINRAGDVTANRFEVPNALFMYSVSTNRGGIGRFGTLSLFFAPDTVALNTTQHSNGFGFGAPSAPDVFLNRDAADTLAQRRGLSPQRFNIYGQYTSSTNFERLFLEYNSTATAFRIGTEKGTSGSARALEFQTDGVTRMTIASTGAATINGSVTLCSDLPNGSVSMIAGRIIFGSSAAGECRFHLGGTTLQNNHFKVRRLQSGAGANIEDFYIGWDSGVCVLRPEASGTGVLGELHIGSATGGTKIGIATTSLLGFYGVTPVDQPATVTDPTGGGTIDTEARTAINAIIDRLQELGLIA